MNRAIIVGLGLVVTGYAANNARLRARLEVMAKHVATCGSSGQTLRGLARVYLADLDG